MISYDEALKIAKDNKNEIDNFEEYENAFVFGFSGDTGFGGSSPVVIDRRSGDALMFAYALGEGMISGSPIHEGVVD